MRNILIILLTVAVVVLMAFLPDLLLNKAQQPELTTEYQQVNITSESSSDYTWRMERLAEFNFGEGENILMTYISEEAINEEGSEVNDQFRQQVAELTRLGVLPASVARVVDESQQTGDYMIHYYYMFDIETVGGFRIAEYTASGKNWHVNLTMDMVSGKLALVQYGGSDLIPGGTAEPPGSSGWYDVLRGYADHLGMDASARTVPSQTSSDTPEMVPFFSARSYYDSCTIERLITRVNADSQESLELRVLRENYELTIAVYDGDP